jgi:phosphoserine phosphatase
MKKLIVFDLDGTLAASKSSLDAEMLSLLHELLGVLKVAVISGGAWLQFERQMLSKLPQDDRLANEHRQQVLDAAYDRNPERFTHARPMHPPQPTAVWINPPILTTTTERNLH